MKKIKLSNGFYTLVDNKDFEWLKNLKIQCIKSKNKIPYAVINFSIPLSRLVVGRKYNSGIQVDHINHNTLDNRRANLRICSNSQNSRNTKKKNKGLFKGVRKCGKKWSARITVNYKEFYLGVFPNPIEAALAYDRAAIKYFGEFANLNFKKRKI